MDAHIFLIGFMGCGKSYLGERLATQLERPFIDLDRLIEIAEGKTIADIFAALGESGFRELERKHLHSLGNQPSAIVATGGGTPCFFDNMDWMNTHGTTVFLETPVETLYERLRDERSDRPLLMGLDDTGLRHFIKEKLREREQWYRQAKVVATVGTEPTNLLEALRK